KSITHLQPGLHQWNQIEINPERDIFLLPYSSGTTGTAKGVMISNKNFSIGITNFASFFKKEVYPFINRENPVTVNDPMQCFLPFNHSFGLITVCFNLYLGTPTIALPVFKFDQMLKGIQDFKVRVIFAVPPILILLANHPIVDNYDLSSLEHISAGAAPVPEDIMYALHKRLPHLKNIQQGYGMTETQVSHANSLRDKYPYGSVGKLLPGFQMK
uniref:AMP-dependent synthetase/ligase domain-containing protein n=1 Tax=Panagrolaimus sp. ES5 TaxID=591445 RepID=A0AC34GI13_9BILA